MHARLARLGRLTLALATLLGATTPVWADEQDIRAEDNAVSLELGATNLDYAEHFGGATVDSEKGWIPTATLGAGLLANDSAQGLLRNLYLHVDLTGSIGMTDYSGAACNASGTCVPATTDTNDSIYATSLQIGRGIALNRQTMLIPYAEIDYRYWSRQVGGAGNSTETYTNWATLGGLMGQVSLAPRWVLSLAGAAGTTFGANMNDGYANYGLGSAFIWDTKAKLGLRVAPRIELTGTIDYSHFEYGRSSTVVEPSSAFCSSGCFEPHSTTNQLTLMSGVAYQF
ncbi:MAG TPA: hypothetical protein VGG27_06195 [Magnetospirillaceae bacterium]|jgi:hypothetical protein